MVRLEKRICTYRYFLGNLHVYVLFFDPGIQFNAVFFVQILPGVWRFTSSARANIRGQNFQRKKEVNYNERSYWVNNVQSTWIIFFSYNALFGIILEYLYVSWNWGSKTDFIKISDRLSHLFRSFLTIKRLDRFAYIFPPLL